MVGPVGGRERVGDDVVWVIWAGSRRLGPSRSAVGSADVAVATPTGRTTLWNRLSPCLSLAPIGNRLSISTSSRVAA